MSYDLVDEEGERARRLSTRSTTGPRQDGGDTHVEAASEPPGHGEDLDQAGGAGMSPSQLRQPPQLLQLQQLHGNRAVRRLLQRSSSPSAGSPDEQPAVRILNPSEYSITPVTEGIHGGSLHLVDVMAQNEWLFKPLSGNQAEGINQGRPGGVTHEVVELNGEIGTLQAWTRKDETLADIMVRDTGLYSEIMGSPLKADFDLVSSLVTPLDKRPENLKVQVNPTTNVISKLEPWDMDTAFPPGAVRDAVMVFLRRESGAQAQPTEGLVEALRVLSVHKEPLHRVLALFFTEEVALSALRQLESTLSEATDASKKARR
jgi:hypothetical protein